MSASTRRAQYGHASREALRHIQERMRSVLGGVTTLERRNDHHLPRH